MPHRPSPLSVSDISLVAPAESPRARLMRLGAEALTDEELLSVLIGRSGADREALGRATRAISAHGLRGLAGEEPDELARLEDIGPTAAVTLHAALEFGRRIRKPERRPRLRTAEQVHQYLEPSFAGLNREVFHVLCVNSANTLLRDVRVAEGSASMCPVDPRDIFAPALACRAVGIIVAHNHPSGDPTPSQQDIHLTRHLARGAELLGLRLLDHVVVGDGYVSFLERGLLPPPVGLSLAIG